MAKQPYQVNVTSNDMKQLLDAQLQQLDNIKSIKQLLDDAQKSLNQQRSIKTNAPGMSESSDGVKVITPEMKEKLKIDKDQLQISKKQLEVNKQILSSSKELMRLRAEEALAITNIAKSMKVFYSPLERFKMGIEKMKTSFTDGGGIRGALLKSFNIAGIFNRSIEREKFINTQKKLGSEKSREELKKDFSSAQKTRKEMDKNEEKIKAWREQTGISQSDMGKFKEGRDLLDKREALAADYKQYDERAKLVGMTNAPQLSTKKSPTQDFADQGQMEEQQIENQRLIQTQTELLEKIEKNTNPQTAEKVQQSSKQGSEGSSEGRGLLGGLLGGNKGDAIMKNMMKIAVGIGALSLSLFGASKAFKAWGEVAWDEVGKGLVVLGGLVVTAKVLKGAMGDMIKASIGIIAISGALVVASKAINEFVKLDWGTMTKAGVVLVGIGTAGLLLGKILPSMLAGAAGLAAMGASIWVIGKALQEFGDTTWETMAKAGVAIAALGASSLLLGPATPLMIAAGAGIGAMGAGIWILGEALQAIGKGFDDMVGGVERLGNIDGNNLWSVAKGLGAVAAAMAAFGASQALAGLGNLVGRLLTIGTDSPIQQLQKISEYGEGIGKAGSGMKDLSQGIKAFSEIKSDTLKETMRSLKEFPWEEATRFVAVGGNVQVDSAKIYNASKTNADAQAMAEGKLAGGNTTVVNAPVNNNSSTNQFIRSVVRNEESSQARYIGKRFATF